MDIYIAAQGERKAQVETPAKMRAGVDSISLVFEINVRTARSEATEPQAERTAVGTVGAPVLENKKAKKLPNQPVRRKACARTTAAQPCLIQSVRRRPARRLSSLQDSARLHTRMTPQDFALASHRKIQP